MTIDDVLLGLANGAIDMPECPKCGSQVTKEVPPEVGEGFVIVRDRICQDCGERFRPPMPASTPWVLLGFGGLLVAAAVAMVIWFVLSTDRDKWRNVGRLATLAFILVALGGSMIVTSRVIFRGGDPDNKIF